MISELLDYIYSRTSSTVPHSPGGGPSGCPCGLGRFGDDPPRPSMADVVRKLYPARSDSRVVAAQDSLAGGELRLYRKSWLVRILSKAASEATPSRSTAQKGAMAWFEWLDFAWWRGRWTTERCLAPIFEYSKRAKFWRNSMHDLRISTDSICVPLRMQASANW